MRSGKVSVVIDTSAESVFDLIHDYARRLEWDPFLRQAYLLEGAKKAAEGVSFCCVARRAAGGQAMDTRYVTFRRPRITAVTMTRGPWFLASFAASIRHEPLSKESSRVTYRYNFVTGPARLRFICEPIVGWILHRETSRRLVALKRFLEAAPTS